MKPLKTIILALALTLFTAAAAAVDTKGVNVQTFGAKCDKTTDDTAAVQKAITYAIANNLALIVDGMCRINPATMVNINRQVDGAAFDKYFEISSTSGGGFYITSDGAMFTSSAAFTTDPVSQLVKFKGINFESDVGGARFVLNGGRFLRTVFEGCSFDRINALNSTIYTQSIYFFHNNVRRVTGTFFSSTSYSYDFKFIGNLVEAHTGTVLSLAAAYGSAIVGNDIEGVSATAIAYNGAQGFSIHGNYFEGNGKDIVGTGATQASGVSIIGNRFSHVNAADYSVVWGSSVTSSVSIGNYHNGSMHNVPAGSDIFIIDAAATSVTNNSVGGNVSGHIGLGRTPSAWGGAWRALEGGSATGGTQAAISFALSGANAVRLFANTYNNGTNEVYAVNAQSGKYVLDGNTHTFSVAAAGVAGNTISWTQALQIGANGGLIAGAATGGDKSVGSINIAGDLYKNNTAYTNPDYVFEKWATGKIERFAHKAGASSYGGLMPLSDVREYAKVNLHLPRFGQAANHGLFSGSDALLASTEEAYLYLFQHDERIDRLEKLVRDLSAKVEQIEAANESPYVRAVNAR